MTSPDPRDGETAGECDLCGLALGRQRGAAVTDDEGRAFCCTGCREVDSALGSTDGVDEADVRERVAGAADGEAGVAEDGPPPGDERAFLRIDGMYCTTCEAFLESVGETADGVDGAEASYVTETLRVDYDPETIDEETLPELFSRAGYRATRRGDALGARRAEEEAIWRLGFGVMAGMFVMIPYLIFIYPVHFQVLYSNWMLEQITRQLENAQYPFYVIFFMTSLVLFYTGWPLLQGAYVSLRARQPNMNLLVSLAALGAYLYSALAVALGRVDLYFDVSVAIVLVVTAGTYYESRMKRRATDQLSELTTATVDTARRYEDGVTEAVPVERLVAGDRVLVREGERVPVDGTVTEGECTVDEAVVTGESLPVAKTGGDEVIGGSVLTDGAAVVEVGEGADAVRAVYCLVDGNNMDPGVREQLLSVVDADAAEVMTTDTHIVNTMEAANQVGGEVDTGELAAVVEELVAEAEADLEPAEVGMAVEHAEVTVFGNDRTETLASTANAMIQMGGVLLLVVIGGAMATSLLILLLTG